MSARVAVRRDVDLDYLRDGFESKSSAQCALSRALSGAFINSLFALDNEDERWEKEDDENELRLSFVYSTRLKHQIKVALVRFRGCIRSREASPQNLGVIAVAEYRQFGLNPDKERHCSIHR